jgi:hypothetical protein
MGDLMMMRAFSLVGVGLHMERSDTALHTNWTPFETGHLKASMTHCQQGGTDRPDKKGRIHQQMVQQGTTPSAQGTGTAEATSKQATGWMKDPIRGSAGTKWEAMIHLIEIPTKST